MYFGVVTSVPPRFSDRFEFGLFAEEIMLTPWENSTRMTYMAAAYPEQ
jgi:hypothetical protein